MIRRKTFLQALLAPVLGGLAGFRRRPDRADFPWDLTELPDLGEPLTVRLVDNAADVVVYKDDVEVARFKDVPYWAEPAENGDIDVHLLRKVEYLVPETGTYYVRLETGDCSIDLMGKGPWFTHGPHMNRLDTFTLNP